jgi:alpha-L-fucosidase
MAISRRLFVLASTALVASTGTSVALAAPGEAASRIPVRPSDTEEDLVRKASQVRPTARQIAWQNLGRTAFLHFGVNTFTGLEWGTGDEDPDVFQPVGLDTDQWARALRDGGFELAILTVKHHDGFVLHPSRYTDHSVASSSWRGGRGDVLRSFADSMRRHGIKVGVYISPADENQYLHGVYANGSARTERTIPTLVDGDDRTDPRTFTLDATDYGAHMLTSSTKCSPSTDPSTRCGSTEHRAAFRPTRWRSTTGTAGTRWSGPSPPTPRSPCPGPMCAGSATRAGSPVRTSGASYRSRGRTTAARTTRSPTTHPTRAAGPRSWRPDRWPTTCSGGRPSAMCPSATAGSTTPASGPKSVDELTDIYFRSVGRNSVLLLNIPPDTQGLLPAADVVRLREFRERVDRELPEDLGRGAVVRSSPGVFTVDLGTEHEVDRIRLAEDIRHGQQVESFVVEAYGAGAWSRVAGAGTIGASRILLLSAPVRARRWRLRVTRSRRTARIAEFALHRSRI